MALRLLLPLALVAATLAGCTDDEEPQSQSEAQVTADVAFDPIVYTFEGSAYRIGLMCFSDGGDFAEDVAGWDFLFEADRDLTYVVWQNAAGENHGTGDQGEGNVPEGAVSFYVCNDLTEPGPLFTATYTLTLTQPAPTDNTTMA